MAASASGTDRLKTAALVLVFCLAAAPSFGAAPRCGSREEKFAWKLTLLGSSKIFPLSMTEVDGSLEGRFFPKATPFALTVLEDGKHWPSASCA